MEKVKIAGISFAVNDNPELALARPEGPVAFVPEPENKFDAGAVRVEWDGKKIGYLPQWEQDIGGGPLKSPNGKKIPNKIRAAVVEHHAKNGAFPDARIEDYSYKPAGTNEFNHDHDGILASILISVDIGEQAEDGNFEFYEKDGEKYERASTILESYDAEGSRGINGGITRWMINTFASHTEYLQFMDDVAGAGTDKHDAIEEACKAKVLDADTQEEIHQSVSCMDDDVFNRVPSGFWNFVANECAGFKMIGTEETVYDGDIFVAGTYDLLMSNDEISVVVDWKSAKQVTLEHIIKTCFYARMKGANEAWVVALGSKNKCGYQLKKVGPVAIENGYQLMKQLAKAKYFTDDLKVAIKEGI